MTPLLAATLTPDGDVTHRDGAWEAVLGTAPTWAGVVEGLLPDDHEAATQAFADAASGHLAAHLVVRTLPVPGDGSGDASDALPLLLHAIPVRLAPGEAVAAVQVVGEALVAPDALPAVRSRRERFEAVGRMTTGIAHDLNNLLAAVLGHGELLAADEGFARAGPDVRAHAAAMAQAAQDGAALVARLQQFLRQEKADAYEPVDLAALAHDVAALTRPYWHHEARRRGVHIECDVEAVPVPSVLGSPVELREVVVNLVLNAVHAMPNGGHLLLSTGHDRAAARVRLDVSDTGVGMDAATAARIFEPLFSTKGDAGSGMGLAVARGLVEAHGGRLDVDSAPGHGTRFSLLLPAAPPERMADAPDAAPDARTTARDASAPPASPALPETPAAHGLCVLVVDDEARVRTVTARLLGLRGHTVVEAGSGAQALERLAAAATSAAPFDAVVTDFGMPGMDGLALAAHVAARWPRLPVLLLTGDTEAGLDDPSGLLAARLAKPFRAAALDAVLRRVVANA